MEIDKKVIDAKIDILNAQFQKLQADAQAVSGALQMCKNLLEHLAKEAKDEVVAVVDKLEGK